MTIPASHERGPGNIDAASRYMEARSVGNEIRDRWLRTSLADQPPVGEGTDRPKFLPDHVPAEVEAYKDGEREGRRIGYALGWKGSQAEVYAAMRLQRQWDQWRDGSEADLRALGDGTTAGAARRMMLPARLARNLGVTWTLPTGIGEE